MVVQPAGCCSLKFRMQTVPFPHPSCVVTKAWRFEIRLQEHQLVIKGSSWAMGDICVLSEARTHFVTIHETSESWFDQLHYFEHNLLLGGISLCTFSLSHFLLFFIYTCLESVTEKGFVSRSMQYWKLLLNPFFLPFRKNRLDANVPANQPMSLLAEYNLPWR